MRFFSIISDIFSGVTIQKLRMTWYKSMKQFRNTLELVIKKWLCSLRDSFPGIDYISNKKVLSGMSKCNYSYSYISTLFELAF